MVPYQRHHFHIKEVVMVGTASNGSNHTKITAPRRTRAEETRDPEFRLRDLVPRPAVRRGVRKHASDWVSRLERRDGMYLPI